MSLVIVSVVCLSSGNVPPEFSLLSILATLPHDFAAGLGEGRREKKKKKNGGHWKIPRPAVVSYACERETERDTEDMNR